MRPIAYHRVVVFVRLLGSSIGLVLSMMGVCAAIGCGGETPSTMDGGASDGGAIDAATDSGPRNPCWDQALMLPCCFSRSNADRRDHPQLKLVDFDNTLPIAFTDPAVAYGFTQALRLDALMVGFAIEGASADGPITFTLGALERRTDGESTWYAWPTGDAPGPGDPTRWDPRTASGTIAGDRISSDPLLVDVVAPVHDTDGTTPVELHLTRLALEDVALTDERSCVGAYDSTGLGRILGSGRITGYLPVEPARIGRLPVVGITPCELLGGGSCDEPQASWPNPPDSLCDESGCLMGECTPDTCNAWRFEARIGAAGVDIR